MFYFKFTADTPYCGTELVDYQKFEERPTDAELDEIAEDIARSNAESFEYLVIGWDDDSFEDEDEEAEALENYYADCCGSWEEITEEEYNEGE
jgi:hypothetical protein